MAQDEIDDSSEIEEHLYKVLVVGDFGVGEVVSVCVCDYGTPLSTYYLIFFTNILFPI